MNLNPTRQANNKGSGIILIAFLISILVMSSTISTNYFLGLHQKRQIVTMNQNEGFLAGEVAAWHSYLRSQTDDLKPLSESDGKRYLMSIENTVEPPTVLNDPSYPAGYRAGQPLSLFTTSRFADSRAIFKHYNSENIKYSQDTDKNIHCGSMKIGGSKHHYSSCLISKAGLVPPPPPPPPVTGCKSWRETTLTNAPGGRMNHTAIWTGDRMIVWGGMRPGSSPAQYYNDGGIYDPIKDSWEPVSSTGAPPPRYFHTAVWTGSKMIVWGGRIEGVWLLTPLASGGVYDPKTGLWKPTATAGAPSPRYEHTAIWTGTHMIIWGGRRWESSLDNGAAYDPNTDSWTPIPADPLVPSRALHTAVWTGSSMIIWGGNAVSTSVNWKPVKATDAPMTSTGGVTAHAEGSLRGGAIYTPNGGWKKMTTYYAPHATAGHTANWTGSKMIVWGGTRDVRRNDAMNDSGGIYDPAENEWVPVRYKNLVMGNSSEQIQARAFHTAVWTGREVLIWNGDTGNPMGARDIAAAYYPGGMTQGSFDALPDTWTPICAESKDSVSMGAYISRIGHSAIWTGSKMIIFGGRASGRVAGGFPAGYETGPIDHYKTKMEYTPVLESGVIGLIYEPKVTPAPLSQSIADLPTPCSKKPVPNKLYAHLSAPPGCSLDGLTIPIERAPDDEKGEWTGTVNAGCKYTPMTMYGGTWWGGGVEGTKISYKAQCSDGMYLACSPQPPGGMMPCKDPPTMLFSDLFNDNVGFWGVSRNTCPMGGMGTSSENPFSWNTLQGMSPTMNCICCANTQAKVTITTQP